MVFRLIQFWTVLVQTLQRDAYSGIVISQRWNETPDSSPIYLGACPIIIILLNFHEGFPAMHKSISEYAEALRCTEGQIRRYIRQNKIPSARLIRSRVGRPAWSITDCSPAAIADLKARIQAERKLRRAVIFHEPVRIRKIGISPDEKARPIWCPTWCPREWDPVIAGHDVITRLALLSEGLTWGDLRSPPTVMSAGLRRIEPLHQEKIKAFEKKRLDWLRKWVCSVSDTDRKELRKLLGDVNRANIILAAEYLALYHRRDDVPITHRTLARVMGVSKSSLYRQYGRKLIKIALHLAQSAATSPTQGMITPSSELGST